jgi:hypothetical protein
MAIIKIMLGFTASDAEINAEIRGGFSIFSAFLSENSASEAVKKL